MNDFRKNATRAEPATALITGAGAGIGKAVAGLFFSAGYNVVAVSLEPDELAVLSRELEPRSPEQKLIVWPMDLSRKNAAERLFHRCHQENLQIDVLINNAGFGLHGQHTSLDLRQHQAMLTLNIDTVSVLCQLFGQEMKERGKGSIVNVGSTSAFQPLPNLAAYAASKAFVVSLTEALANELKPYGVQVHCVCPGTTKTAFLDRAGLQDNERFGSTAYIAHRVAMRPEKVARVIFDAAFSDKTLSVPGIINQLHFGLAKILPERLMTPLAAGVLGRR
ncbi:MAG: SDR family NAD(P)-dependent oxidoreductase [Ketobacteraceae bacterium]|nr:SDR family NAD(P)-dependent oxidoreductase [Ketobacteraceae bacterium]